MNQHKTTRTRAAYALAASLGIAALVARPAHAQAPTGEIPPPVSTERVQPPVTLTSAPPMPQPAPLQVTVNGAQIAFAGTGPMMLGDSVLVPLRGVFEKLGADVRYDAASRTITARKGQTTVVTRIGDTNATVNGTAKTLSTAPQVIGSATLVPLRFVSEALGAQVNWRKGSDTIAITTDATVAEKLPTPAAGSGELVGTLTGVYPEAQAITVRLRDGQNRRIPLAGSYSVQEQTGAKSLSLNDLVVGQQVVVNRNGQGQAAVVQVLQGERRGIVKRFEKTPSGTTRLLLTNGTSIELAPGIPIRMDEAVISIADIKPGERVIVRVDPKTGQGIGMAVITPNNPNPILPGPGDTNRPDPNPPPVPRSDAAPATHGDIALAVASEGVSAAPVVNAADPPVTDPPPATPPTTPPQTPTPPATPAPTEASAPAITEVSHDAKSKALKGGDTVTITVKGTPKAEVGISVPSLYATTNVPLTEKEDEPGTYQGTLTVPFNTVAPDAHLTAVLKAGDAEPVKRDFTDALNVDSEGPEIKPVTPGKNATVEAPRPTISVTFADMSQVDPASVHLIVNDVDMTEDATITATGLTYTPKTDFKAGAVALSVAALDTRGNATRTEWTFTVKPVVPTLSRISAAPTGTLLRTGAQITVRAEGAPGNRARYQLGTLTEGEMTEESPGVYVGTYTVKKGDTLRKSAATIIMTPRKDGKDGAPVVRDTTDTITVSAGPLAAPVIEYPKEAERVGKEYAVFSGKAEPFSKVRLTVTYEGKVTFSKRSEKLFDTEVQVDETGHWKTDPFGLTVPKDVSGVSYVVSAVAFLENEDTSPAATVRFKK